MRYLITLSGLLASASPAFAQAAEGKPVQAGVTFQEPATELARRVFSFHDNLLLWMCIIITLFVAALLVYVIIRYNRKANPEPSKTTHNTMIEVVWTAIPVLILIAISVVSFPLLYYVDRAPDLDRIVSGEITASVEEQAAASEGWLNIKAQGNQWNWTYSYEDVLDGDGFPLEFTSNPLHVGNSQDTSEGELYLSVDYPMVVPTGRYVRYYTAASDVIHSFAMPSFGIKTDAIPGRLNEGWFRVERPGVYYGQCSELCGKNHAFMPIEIRVVPQDQYEAWLETMQSGDFDRASQLVATIQTENSALRLAEAQ